MIIRAKGKTLGQDRFSSSEFETEFYLFDCAMQLGGSLFPN